MVREQYITRAISTQLVRTLAYSKETGGVISVDVKISPPVKNRDALDKVVSKKLNENGLKLVDIDEVEQITTLLGVTFDDFIKNAVELDPATRKAIQMEE